MYLQEKFLDWKASSKIYSKFEDKKLLIMLKCHFFQFWVKSSIFSNFKMNIFISKVLLLETLLFKKQSTIFQYPLWSYPQTRSKFAYMENSTKWHLNYFDEYFLFKYRKIIVDLLFQSLKTQYTAQVKVNKGNLGLQYYHAFILYFEDFGTNAFFSNQSTDSTCRSIVFGWENGPERRLKTVSLNP